MISIAYGILFLSLALGLLAHGGRAIVAEALANLWERGQHSLLLDAATGLTVWTVKSQNTDFARRELEFRVADLRLLWDFDSKLGLVCPQCGKSERAPTHLLGPEMVSEKKCPSCGVSFPPHVLGRSSSADDSRAGRLRDLFSSSMSFVDASICGALVAETIDTLSYEKFFWGGGEARKEWRKLKVIAGETSPRKAL